MKSSMSWEEYQRLELIPTRSTKFSSANKLNDLWQWLIGHLATSSEPHVWKTWDDAGSIQWKAYDPMTGQSVRYDSEDEMRVWLEERHYQHQGFAH